MKQPFSQALGGKQFPMLCWDYVPFLSFAGTTRGKQGQQLPYKLMEQDKDCSPFQFAGTAVPYAYE